MPNLYGGTPFQDLNDEERYRQDELEMAGLAAAQARALGLGPSSAQHPEGANASFAMSMLDGADASAASPYFGRQQGYGNRGYVQPHQQGMYGSLQSPADQMYAPQANYRYAASPDPGFQSHYGGVPQAAPSHDFNTFFRGQQAAREQAMIDHAIMQRREEEETAALIAAASARKAVSQLSYLSQQAQSKPATKAPSIRPKPASSASKSGGRGGRGGRGRGGRSSGRGSGGRGGRGRGKSVPTKSPEKTEEEATESPVEPPNGKWFSGCVPLGLPEDKFWLSELQVYLRANFAEAFGATEADIAAPMHGRNKPIALGQVGIRCMHCKDDAPSERGQQATSYPSLISGIYNSVQQMLRLHFDCCMALPPDIRQKIESLKVSSSARGGRKQYWIDSAKRLGLVDTPYGIHFGRDPTDPLPPLEGPMGPPSRKNKAAAAAKAAAKQEAAAAKAAKEAAAAARAESKDLAKKDSPIKDEEMKAGKAIQPIAQLPPEQLYPLVLPEDKDLISDYLYLTLEQMQPANLSEADKVGCYKAREVGFPGLACKHCVGQAGCGRYFPASEASLSQTTTSQTIMNHVRNCRRCPIETRENLELMKRARMGPDGKRAEKPKHGGRKVFFHRLWCRIQRIPMDSEDEAPKRKKKKKQWARRKALTDYRAARRKAVASVEDSSLSDMDHGRAGGFDDSEMSSGEQETETEHSDMSDDGSDGSIASGDRKPKAKRSNKKQARWFEGVVRLAKSDDPHWMSEMHCFTRNELLEIFTLAKNENLNGYNGRKEPSVGQVGLRCVFCARQPKAEQPPGSVHFPELLSSIDTKIGDMIRLHFPSCPAMPDDLKETFRSLRIFGPKVSDSHQYWVDAARDLGLADIPPKTGGWGITFHRDPIQPSPADDIDREIAGAETYAYDKGSLVRAADRGTCTDQVMLLLRQVKACRFKKTDRRGGPGPRGRDRVLGFPGLCCKHCTSRTNFGRYFPVSAKNLTDHTANSLQLHLQSCSRCPEDIKASLAYLSHRSTMQKAELRGSWKKTFFKRVWDRLHVERAWDDPEGDIVENEDDSAVSSGEDQSNEGGSQETESASDDEEAAISGMADLIKAAAVWLSEQEAPGDSTRSSSVSGRDARALPSNLKRPSPYTPKARGRALPSAKRRRLDTET